MRQLILAALVMSLAGCIAVVKQPPSNNPPPPQNPPPHHDPPPPEARPLSWPAEAPNLPPGTRWFDDKLQLKYDAALDDCYEASKKALGFMKFSEADVRKKVGELTATAGTIFVHCTMYRLRHHTYLTFYFRVHGHRADARMPQDFANKCHDFVGKQVKEQGRKAD